jgi:hypothetical protein
MLGKVNMEGHWCIWCNLCKNDWSEKNHLLGTPWTINALTVHCATTHTTRNERKGVVKPVVYDTVEVKDYIVPCLHLLLGLGNNPLDHLFLIIDFFVEPLTPNLLL